MALIYFEIVSRGTKQKGPVHVLKHEDNSIRKIQNLLLIASAERTSFLAQGVLE